MKKAVLDKARSEAAEILSRTRKEADDLMASAAKQARKNASAILEKARTESGEESEREIAAFERSMRLKALEEKNTLIDEVIERAGANFKALPSTKLMEFYSAELQPFDLSASTLRVPKGTGGLFAPMVAKGARIDEDAALEAGFVLVKEHFRLDRSLKARLDEVRSEIKSQIARILFQEEAS